jgi:carbamoyl-phosphate synthase large subunit
MHSYNPETVSTDFDESDRLYFDELSLERVLDINEFEQSSGVVVSCGGQQPQNLALALHESKKVHVLGTSPLMIDRAEDRQKFSSLLDALHIAQPAWRELTDMAAAHGFAAEHGYPVLVRPSYVLSGAAMRVAHTDAELGAFLGAATSVSPHHPVVMTKFYDDCRELDVDGVASAGTLVNWAVSEHVENAGVHSGDATLVFPALAGVGADVCADAKRIASQIARALQISGPFNMQLLLDPATRQLSVIECNLRASRSFPFVSKALNVDFMDTCAQVFLSTAAPASSGRNKQQVVVDATLVAQAQQQCGAARLAALPYVAVKAPQFSHHRLHGSDPVLGVEMASTGEVATFGTTRHEAYLKSVMAAGFKIPTRGILLSGDCALLRRGGYLLSIRRIALELRLPIYTFGEAACRALLEAVGGGDDNGDVEFEFQHLGDDADAAALSRVQALLLERSAFDLVINFVDANTGSTGSSSSSSRSNNNRLLRRFAVDYAVPLITQPQLAVATIDALAACCPASVQQLQLQDQDQEEEECSIAGPAPSPSSLLSIKSWDEWMGEPDPFASRSATATVTDDDGEAAPAKFVKSTVV